MRLSSSSALFWTDAYDWSICCPTREKIFFRRHGFKALLGTPKCFIVEVTKHLLAIHVDARETRRQQQIARPPARPQPGLKRPVQSPHTSVLVLRWVIQ
mmetsp:Transcript_31074/g.90308  ORF Transcript_31074/g.90308 Transcript_31074/m.90308 type:complete len:99 (+) Transcript_31074:897-1193(+)